MQSKNTKSDIFFLAHYAGQQMISRLEWMILSPKVVLNMGNETAYCAALLEKQYPNAKITATDIIQTPDHSVDLIFANLCLPWCTHSLKIFQEWQRILQPKGLLIFSSFGPDTLIELQEKYSGLILPNLADMHYIGDELITAHFTDPVLDVEHLTVTYRETKKLMKELKTNKMITQEISDISLQPHQDNVFSLSYELIYGHAWNPSYAADSIADEPGVTKIPLSHLRRKKS